MKNERTYYEILGVDRTAPPHVIKSRYHDLARRFHPDRAQDKVIAERLFAQINLAYRALINRETRAAYDLSLFQNIPEKQSPVVQAPVAPPPPPSDLPNVDRPPVSPPPQLDVMEAMWRANAAYMSGDRVTAHKTCMAVLDFDPMNSEAHSLAGDMFADQRRFQEALSEYSAAAAIGQPTFTLKQKTARMQLLLAQPRTDRSKNPRTGTGRPK